MVVQVTQNHLLSHLEVAGGRDAQVVTQKVHLYLTTWIVFSSGAWPFRATEVVAGVVLFVTRPLVSRGPKQRVTVRRSTLSRG